MTPADLFRSTLGFAHEGFKQVYQIKDDTRFVTFYRIGDIPDALNPLGGVLLISFGPTLGNLYWGAGEDLPKFLENGKDWLRNFDIGKIYGVHRGFLREWEGLADEVRSQINFYQPQKLLLTGFSQGSAHATLATRALADLGIPIETSAFATPRVFGWIAGATYDNWLTVTKSVSLTRYNHRRDPVQHAPLGIQGFAHVGHQVKLGGAGWWDFAKYHDPGAYTNELDKLE